MIKFLINRPIAVITSFVLVSLLGILSLKKTPTSLLPDATIPKLEVIIENPDKSIEDFEKDVTKKVRENLQLINQLADINCYTDRSSARIELIFDYNTNIDLIRYEVNEKIDDVLNDLPYRIKSPKVIKSSLSDIPSLYLAVSLKNSSNRKFQELSDFVHQRIKNRFEQIPEVSFIDITGVTKNEINLSINESVMNSYGITLSDVSDAISNNNSFLGEIEVTKGHFVYKLSIENTIHSIEELKETILPGKEKVIKLSDVATIEYATIIKDEYFNNLNKAISLAIVKNPNSRETDFFKKVTGVINQLEESFPDLDFSITKNQTELLNTTFDSLMTSLLLAILLSVLITLVFLKSLKNTINIVFTVIVSLLLDVLLFYVFNISMNLISISGLILGVGLMIDNIIIVLDNIEQKVSAGVGVKQSCIDGVLEIKTALITSALTTSLIFVPLIFLSGLVGVLFYDQAVAITVSLFSSYVASIILLPTLYALLFKSRKNIQQENSLIPFYIKISKIFDTKIAHIGIIFFVIFLLGIASFKTIKKEQLPTIEPSEIVFKVQWNKNYPNNILLSRSKAILEYVNDEIISSELYINHQNFFSNTQRKDLADFETLFILKIKNLTDLNNLKNKIAQFLDKNYNSTNIEFLSEETPLNAMLVTDEYNLKIISYDLALDAKKITNKIKKKFPNVITKVIGETEKIEISINDDLLLIYDLNKESIINLLKSKNDNQTVTDLNNVPIIFNKNNSSISEVLSTNIFNKNGQKFKLSDIAEVEVKKSKKIIESDTGGLANIIQVKTTTPDAIINFIKNEFPTSNITFEGDFKFVQKLKKEFLMIALVILLLLYLVLTIQFESLKLPFIILIEIPIGIAFSMTMLYITNQTLNVMSFIGIIITCGIIINDSILKIDLINKLVRKGTMIEEAIHKAGKTRLNAILMTSLTTMLAITPILFQNDFSAQLQKPLTISILSGLSLGTLISIFLIPYLYKKFI